MIDSRDIHVGLVDTYWTFDLTELCFSVEESEQCYFKEEYGCDFGDHNLEIDFDTSDVVLKMAEIATEFFKDKLGLKLKVKSTGSPREYNFSTDWCVWDVENGSEDTIEKMKSAVLGENGELSEEYFNNMIDELNTYLFERIKGYSVGGKSYSFEALIREFGGKENE